MDKMDNSVFTVDYGKEDDADQIYHVHTSAIRKVCAGHYSPEQIELWAGKQSRNTYEAFLRNREIIVSKNNGVVIGFIHHIDHGTENYMQSAAQDKRKEMEIKGLFIHPHFIRQSVGTLLLEKVESLAIEKGSDCLIVSASLNSVPFYSKMDFQEIERKPHEITCQCSVECVSMIKHLGN